MLERAKRTDLMSRMIMKLYLPYMTKISYPDLFPVMAAGNNIGTLPEPSRPALCSKAQSPFAWFCP